MDCSLLFTNLVAIIFPNVGVPSPCQAVACTDFQPGHRLSLFASSSGQLSGLWRTNVLHWGQRAFFFLGFLASGFTGWPVLVPGGGRFSLSGCWAGVRLSRPATSAFIFSIMASMVALFVAAIAAICLSCCSCSIAKSIACDSPSSSAAAVS